jgi:hypothetical protein
MACNDKVVLFQAYVLAVSKFSDAVSIVSRQVDIMSREDYEYAYLAIEQTLQDFAAAKFRLETHVTTHRC